MPPWIGPGAHDGDLDDEIVEARGLAAAAASTAARATRSGTRRRCRRAGTSRRRRDLRPGCPASAARCRGTATIIVERAADRGEHAERQAVDLEQAHRVEVVLVPLDDRAVLHRRVLDRHHALEQAARDDEAADVLRQVAREAHELAGERDEPRDQRIVGIEAGFADARGIDRCGRPTTRTRRSAGRPARGRGPSALPTSRIALFGR